LLNRGFSLLEFGLQVSVLLTGWVAGTALVDAWQFTVAQDASFGIIMGESLQQLVESMFLLLSTCIGLLPILIQPTFIDHTKGTTVIACGMDTLNRLRQQGDNCPITTDIVVVAALSKLFLAAAYQLIHAEGLVAPGCGAVNNNVLDGI
jgi:hypothetical protein